MDMKEFLKCIHTPDYMAKKYFFDDKYCMAYSKESCSGEIVQSHTISKMYLKSVAENGRVYLPKYSSNQSNNLIEFQLKHIHSATTMPGFCQYHDNRLFSSFEKEPFQGLYNQIYDITFRSLCREYFLKKCLHQFFIKVSDGDLKSLDRTGYTKSSYFKEHQKHLIQEMKDHKFLYNQIMKVKSGGLSYLLIKLERLPILATGVYFPLINPIGQAVQNIRRKQLGFIYNAITLKNESYILIATVNTLHNNIHSEYLKSLKSMPIEKLTNYFINIFFFNNDNIVIEPPWFNQLDQEFKNSLVKMLNLQVGHYSDISLQENLDFGMAVAFNNIKVITKIE